MKSATMSKVSQFVRWALVLLIALTVVKYVLFYLEQGKPMFGITGVMRDFYNLWEINPQARTTLYLMTLPGLLILFTTIYQLQRLFGLFAQGEFFNVQSFQAVRWIVWLYFAHILSNLLMPIAFINYQHQFDSTVQVAMAIDPYSIFVSLFLVVIFELFKVAQKIDAENKEFV